MPYSERPDGKPVVEFDPALEISPFTLFRRLREGRELLIVDVRSQHSRLALDGATRWPGEGWTPPQDRDVVLVDNDGSRAVSLAVGLHQRGFPRVRALFGGLELYEFALDPEVVGDETYLRRAG